MFSKDHPGIMGDLHAELGRGDNVKLDDRASGQRMVKQGKAVDLAQMEDIMLPNAGVKTLMQDLHFKGLTSSYYDFHEYMLGRYVSENPRVWPLYKDDGMAFQADISTIRSLMLNHCDFGPRSKIEPIPDGRDPLRRKLVELWAEDGTTEVNSNPNPNPNPILLMMTI
jgi:uncharacterized protein YutD